MFKRAKVVMLPTNEKAENCLIKRFNRLSFYKGYFTQEYLSYNLAKAYHLYILSDEEIKESNWYLTFQNNKVIGGPRKCEDSSYSFTNCKKIIATTDKSLGNSLGNSKKVQKSSLYELYSELPQIPQSFIEKYIEEYNKGNIITEVMVEYQAYREDGCPFYLQSNGLLQAHDEHGWETLNIEDAVFKLKINPKDNTISIRKIKDSWNKEEHITNLLKYRKDYEQFKKDCHFGPNEKEIEEWSEKWIKENL